MAAVDSTPVPAIATESSDTAQPIQDADSQLVKVPLDESLYSLGEELATFFKQQTGIQDDEELKRHAMEVQKEAYDVYHYPCIRHFMFMQLRISARKAYPDMLKLAKEKPDAIFLDYGCCFGCDIRKAIADGFPMQNAIASDIQPDFWRLGHKLFRTTPETFPVVFVPGDVFDPKHIAPIGPLYTQPPTPRPDLHTLTSLNPLQGHVSSIFTGAFFHLFHLADQLTAARALASLLSPEPGSFIFGSNAAHVDARSGTVATPRGGMVFWQSPETWREMWDGQVFEKGTVDVFTDIQDLTGLVNIKQMERETKMYIMDWCIRRK